MKKKKILIIIICTLFVSLFLVSMTYAKYISSIDMSDEARVAVWDIDATTDVDLFKSSYYINEEEIEGNEYVKSLTGSKVVAPGTEGQYEFTISGKPETNYRLLVNVDTYDSIGRDPSKKGSKGRMIYYLGQGNDLEEYDNIDDLARGIEQLFDYNRVYAAGTSPSYIKNENMVFTIKWKWLFEDVYENGEVKTGQDLIEADAIDTGVGNSAILEQNGGVDEGEEYENQPRVRLTVKVVAEQAIEAATTAP